MKRKTRYIVPGSLAVMLALVTLFWVYPQKIYRTTMIDGVGGPGLGFGNRGIGQSMWNWKSWDGSEVFETAISYTTRDDARKDFEEELKTAKTIYQQTGAANDRRVVAKFHSDNTVTVVTLNNTEIRHAEAGSLQEALTFQRSWLKLY